MSAVIISFAEARAGRCGAVRTPQPEVPKKDTPLDILNRIAIKLGLPPMEDEEPPPPRSTAKPRRRPS